MVPRKPRNCPHLHLELLVSDRQDALGAVAIRTWNTRGPLRSETGKRLYRTISTFISGNLSVAGSFVV